MLCQQREVVLKTRSVFSSDYHTWIDPQDADDLVVASICPDLEGNICATYGVGLLSYEDDVEGGEEERSICHANRVVTVPIQSFIEFGLWAVGGKGTILQSLTLPEIEVLYRAEKKSSYVVARNLFFLFP